MKSGLVPPLFQNIYQKIVTDNFPSRAKQSRNICDRDQRNLSRLDLRISNLLVSTVHGIFGGCRSGNGKIFRLGFQFKSTNFVSAASRRQFKFFFLLLKFFVSFNFFWRQISFLTLKLSNSGFSRKSVFCCFTLDCSWPSSAGL